MVMEITSTTIYRHPTKAKQVAIMQLRNGQVRIAQRYDFNQKWLLIAEAVSVGDALRHIAVRFPGWTR